MKALAVVPGTAGARLVDRSEPAITSPDEVAMRVVRVGLCGTDREEVAGGRAQLPAGQSDLVIGHEMFGQVVDVGSSVKTVARGDFAVFTVRRGCGACGPCAAGRADMCETGRYTERGIWGRDGYQSARVVDREAFIVRVPAELESVGVLAEPLSVAEKAIAEVEIVQTARLPGAKASAWWQGKRCLIAGLGPIGLLAALALRLRQADVWGLDVVDAASVRPRWLEGIGGHYLDGRAHQAGDAAPDVLFDVILEAAGIASLQFALIDRLAVNGAYVLTGIPSGDRPVTIDGGELMRRLVLRNQIMLGSVNASRDHFRSAIDDLGAAATRWPGAAARLITQRQPYTAFADAFAHHGDDEIKVVLEWS